MGESLTQRHRVEDEGFRVVNSSLVVHWTIRQKAPANYVPAAAVRHRVRALSGFTGRKESVGGRVGCWLKPPTQLEKS